MNTLVAERKIENFVNDSTGISNATLNNAKKGNFLTITQLPEGNIRSQLIRLGLLKGQNAECLERLPGGTIILQKHRQEIAIGSDLARQIDIYIH